MNSMSVECIPTKINPPDSSDCLQILTDSVKYLNIYPVDFSTVKSLSTRVNGEPRLAVKLCKADGLHMSRHQRTFVTLSSTAINDELFQMIVRSSTFSLHKTLHACFSAFLSVDLSGSRS